MSLDVIDSTVRQTARALHERFASAQPFPYVVIENFFTEDYARRLVEQFPVPDASLSPNLFGAAGKKAFRHDLTLLGPAYRMAHQLFGSAEFLNWLGTLTGIERLLYDPTNYGGGTHENYDGRDLRPHVDFNFHPVTKLHRRVNLIVYLNEDWQTEWGGSIALHRDPRDPLDEVVAYPPTFNRCIIFETSERSWHSFDRINLPADQKHRTRKSLSLYFYTRERPEHEIHKPHTTFFIPRPLPPRFVSGYTLSAEDETELGELLGHRDRLIQLYQREQGRSEADPDAARMRILVAELSAKQRLPILGYAWAEGAVSGRYRDGWSGAELRFSLRAERPISSIAVRVRVPDRIPENTLLRIHAGDTLLAEAAATPGIVEMQGSHSIPAGSVAEIVLSISATINFQNLGLSADERDLGFILERMTLEHAEP